MISCFAITGLREAIEKPNHAYLYDVKSLKGIMPFEMITTRKYIEPCTEIMSIGLSFNDFNITYKQAYDWVNDFINSNGGAEFSIKIDRFYSCTVIYMVLKVADILFDDDNIAATSLL